MTSRATAEAELAKELANPRAEAEARRAKVSAALAMCRLARKVLEGGYPASSLMMQHGAVHAHRQCMAVAVKALNAARLRRAFRRGELAKAEVLARLVLARADASRWDLDRLTRWILDELGLARPAAQHPVDNS